MMNGRTVFLVTLLIVTYPSQSQTFKYADYFRSPLDIPLYLSGNFGELRSTHFHAGLDFKTQGTIGKNVYAVADGYVSRIKVRAGGYGNALYINHPNGLTTVYGHLHAYNDNIATFVKKYQYRNNTHQFDLYLKNDQIPVKKGEIIGISGNSGSSSGPHLHFEIRESLAQRPRNGLLYDFNVRDNIKPSIRGIAIYDIMNNNEKKIIDAYGNNGNFHLRINGPITIPPKAGFGIEAYDYLNGSANRCGIYSIEMLIDSVQVYYHEVKEFGFNESGYIKSHVDYGERLFSGRKFQKMQLDPNNFLGFYKKAPRNKGYWFDGEKTYHIQFNVKDSYGNLSTLSFNVRPKQNANQKSIKEKPAGEYMPWNKENSHESNGIRVYIPQKALFNDIYFTYEETNKKAGFSHIHKIHNRFTPLNKYIKLYLKTNIPKRLQEKALIVEIEENGSTSSIGGTYEFGYVTATTKYFGNYAVDVDTIPPRIVPLNIYNNANMQGKKSIRFRVDDDLSGVKSYNGYIDGEWVLFEYDAKNDLIQYFFDEERLEPEKYHDLELFIMDTKDNLSTYTATFYY